MPLSPRRLAPLLFLLTATAVEADDFSTGGTCTYLNARFDYTLTVDCQIFADYATIVEADNSSGITLTSADQTEVVGVWGMFYLHDELGPRAEITSEVIASFPIPKPLHVFEYEEKVGAQGVELRIGLTPSIKGDQSLYVRVQNKNGDRKAARERLATFLGGLWQKPK